MVTVTMLCQNGRAVGFTSTGHANFGEAGEDVVCSAISAITQTCVLGLTQVAGLRAGKHLALEIGEETGITCILSGDTDEEQQQKAELLFSTMEEGLRSIKASYRGAIKILHREV